MEWSFPAYGFDGFWKSRAQREKEQDYEESQEEHLEWSQDAIPRACFKA